VVLRDAVGARCRELYDDDEVGNRRPVRRPHVRHARGADEAARPGRLEVAAPRDFVRLGEGGTREPCHEYRIRGSRNTYTTSTTKLMRTNTEASRRTRAWISV